MGYLAIVRHGEAAPGQPDHERHLTLRGEAEASSVGEWVARTPSLAGALLWSSPYRRAQQTARAIAGTSGLTLETVEGMTPDDDIDALIERLARWDAVRPLIVVSHMPLVGALAGRLVDGGTFAGMAFPTAGIALLEADVWAAGCATLKAFVGPPHA